MPPADSSTPAPTPTPEVPKKQSFWAKLFGGKKEAEPALPAGHESQAPEPQLNDPVDPVAAPADLSAPAPAPDAPTPAPEPTPAPAPEAPVVVAAPAPTESPTPVDVPAPEVPATDPTAAPKEDETTPPTSSTPAA